MKQTAEARELFTGKPMSNSEIIRILECPETEFDRAAGFDGKARRFGRLWAQQATYLQLLYVVTKDDRYQNFDTDDPVWDGSVRKCLKADPGVGRGKNGSLGPLTESWINGWFFGIAEFCDLVDFPLPEKG